MTRKKFCAGVSGARARWGDLFAGIYAPRTLGIWVMWFCSASISYGLQTWLPTILRTVYKLPVSEAIEELRALFNSLWEDAAVLTSEKLDTFARGGDGRV